MRADAALEIARLRFGERAHVIEASARRTFADLDREATRFAAALAAAGVGTGDRVALRIANRFADVAAVFGVWRAGAVLVPLNPRLTGDEQRLLCERSGARVLAAVREGTELTIEETLPAGVPEPELAAIAFTSGTTGLPKGVEITHAALLWSAMAVAKTRGDALDSVAAVVSPLCHLPVFVSHYLARLLSGGTVVLGQFDPDRLVASLAEQGITDLPLVPAMVGPLLERDVPASVRLRKVSVGSALTPMEVKEALAARFGGADVVEAYGQTETTDGVTMTVGREALERPGTVGRPHATLALAVLGRAGNLAPSGQDGELVFRGPTLMRGYHADSAATAAAFHGPWLRTGDLGRIDEDGYVYVTGRLKEIIITGGENVSPAEVEAVLGRHPAVAEAAVFGIPDPRWGERVAAAVVTRDEVTPEALQEHVARHLARFKLPRTILFLEELPKTSAGKVKRAELRDRFAKSPARP